METTALQVKPQNEGLMPLTERSEILANDPEGRAALAMMVSHCFEALKVYGKKPEQVENIVQLFGMVLAEHRSDDIKMAFIAYLQNHVEMPTPSDIVGYIRRKGRPAMDKSIYIALCQKRERTAWRHGPQRWEQGDGLSDSETEFVKEYEETELVVQTGSAK